MLIFADSCYSDTCLGKEDVRVCALDGLWPEPVRTGPFPIGGALLCSMHVRWQLPLFTVCLIGCGWFPTHLEQNFLAYPGNTTSFSVAIPGSRVMVEQRQGFSLALDMILPSEPIMDLSKKLFLHFAACQFDPDSPLLLWWCPSEV